jgi:hypothetical protein
MATNAGGWGGRRSQELRRHFATTLPQPCGLCGEVVHPGDEWVLGHIKSRMAYPELTFQLDNLRAEHRSCSNRTGSATKQEVRDRRAAEGDVIRGGVIRNGGRTGSSVSGGTALREESAPVRALSPPVTPVSPVFDPASLEDVPWCADLLDIPADASWPRYMTPVHPDAVGSYGGDFEEWLLTQQGITMRHWQRLASRRQLEFNADGELCWQTVVESCPRRAGKSTRLAGIATWRMAHPELFGEVQTVIHTGSDMAICREIQRRAWRWAEDVAGWVVMRANGKESMETHRGDRWLVRAQSAVYGWDCSLGLVDEGWDVPPAVVDEGLEPALLERLQPQLVLTSTAHRRATPLMRRRIAAALAGMGEDWDTLLMLWAAGPDDDIGEEATWRAASPHWSPQRLKMISGKYERAMRGEADPEADDLDPIEGFKAQFLNVWPEAAPKVSTGEPIFTAASWASLNGYEPAGAPAVAAVENWFAEGVSVALATPLEDGTVGVTVRDFPDVTTAGTFATTCGAQVVLAGKALASDPALAGSVPVAQVVRLALVDLQRFANEGTFRHDDSPMLTEQALALRRVKTPDGQRVVSTGRMDALKATAFAVDAARRNPEQSAVF